MIMWFLAIALIPLAIATYISYDSSRKALEKEAKMRLFAVADNEAGQIETYLRGKEKDIAQLSFMPNVRAAFEKFNDAYSKTGFGSLEYEEANHEHRPFLEYYRREFDYEDILLISPEGNVVFSLRGIKYPGLFNKTAAGADAALADVFARSAKLQSFKAEVSNFEYDLESGKAVVFIAAPFLNGGRYAGTVVACMSTDGISELVRDYTGLGETGETIVAARMGKHEVVITPLRFGSSERGAVQKAILGEKGSGISIDYRGKETLGIWRYIAPFHLSIVVKMDTGEIFASSDKLRGVLLGTSSALLAVVVIVAILVAKTISGPVEELTKVSSTITRGNLTTRAQIDTGDEIGDLADSFNRMTDSLVEAKARVQEQKTEVEEQKKLLEKVNKELDSFVYTASHDLRAPLRAISSFSGFLEEDYKKKLGKEGMESLSEIRNGANRMNSLIEDLLKLSRISRIKNPYEDVDMKALVNSVIERIKFDIDKNKVDLKVQEKMPGVHCDRIKMAEVFLNLMTNAIKFSSKNNKENPKVEVGYEEKPGAHQFYVKDNGIGIAPEHKDNIFGIFRRLEASKDYEGTGAGLAIVKRIIDDHEGKVWVDSEPGKGATFRFTIPKKAA